MQSYHASLEFPHAKLNSIRPIINEELSSSPQVTIRKYSHSHVPSKPIILADADPGPVQVGVVFGGGGGALVDVVGRHGGRPR